MKNELYPAIVLESSFPRRVRRVVEKTLTILIVLLVSAGFFAGHQYQYWGAALILFSGLLKCYLLDAFFYSTYVRASVDHEKTFPLSSVLKQSEHSDPLKAFSTSRFGTFFITRLGISLKYVQNLTLSVPLPKNKIDDVKNLGQYFMLLVKFSPALDIFLKKYSINEDEIYAVGEWIERSFDNSIQRERWWSRENLARLPGLGKDWAYGQTDTLERYGLFVNGFMSSDPGLYEKEVGELESVLSKSRSANAILISDTDDIRLSIIRHLAAMIDNGTSHPALEHKKVFLLDGPTFSERAGDQQSFENQFLRLLYEAERVGNIIFVIDNFPVFIKSAANLGVDTVSLMVPFLRSSSMQCVVLSDSDAYYKELQSKTDISQNFELVRVDIKDERSVFIAVEDRAAYMEYKYGVFFTYQAIEAAVESARTYFQSDDVAVKAKDIIVEMAPRILQQKKYLIAREDVLDFVQMKTGIPTGEASETEKAKLLNLEELLHQRVIGQNEAVSALSQAMRRSRSGLGKPNRPIGSFLFLGPTGVGKTETSKALSDIFFGSKSPMVRFDMSEYSGVEALSRLIGDSSSLSPGLLANEVRAHPYGVLLLDEFEKASEKVHNLFLQILDEGYFSDIRGKKVNLKNMIIIATSNAAVDQVSLSAGNVFRPELINRFDGVIFFSSLNDNDLKDVTSLLLKDFITRLNKKGVDLEVTDDLISALIAKGHDPHFGARPMNRAIANLVEEKIAEGLIAGTVKRGDKVRFVKDEKGELVMNI